MLKDEKQEPFWQKIKNKGASRIRWEKVSISAEGIPSDPKESLKTCLAPPAKNLMQIKIKEEQNSKIWF